MDAMNDYRELVERILRAHTVVPYAHGNIRILPVFDREIDQYLVMLVGSQGIRRVHGCLIHVEIADGKLLIQRDGTEYGIARELTDAGVPREQIVLAFRPTEDHQDSPFAVA